MNRALLFSLYETTDRDESGESLLNVKSRFTQHQPLTVQLRLVIRTYKPPGTDVWDADFPRIAGQAWSHTRLECTLLGRMRSGDRPLIPVFNVPFSDGFPAKD
ncbi:uncharacterized protein AKAW2_60040A [Aspergillus luchuensis]|uniref:Uncharacterized protein n=1 Tax=Aspergillus kawachii TaxID=1069201 RepID=A0A7R7WFE5_ASPKA|nr:uncharacterized protein AKAW2_60040A [Aspergillus luchuensis]BCS01776.1 hypothetical protein AKAW2_60040A [Aspergillus luchuensis]